MLNPWPVVHVLQGDVPTTPFLLPKLCREWSWAWVGGCYPAGLTAPPAGWLLAQHSPSPVYQLHCFRPGGSQTSSVPLSLWKTAPGAEQRGGSGEGSRQRSTFQSAPREVISVNIRVSALGPCTVIHSFIHSFIHQRKFTEQLLGARHCCRCLAAGARMADKTKSLPHKAYNLVTASLGRQGIITPILESSKQLAMRHLNMG